MGGKRQNSTISVEEHDQKEIDDALAGIKKIAKEAWHAALSSRGMSKNKLDEIDFEGWWKDKVEMARTAPHKKENLA